MLMHRYPCTFPRAFLYQLNILESIVTFAEFLTRTFSVCWNVPQWINSTTRFLLALKLQCVMFANSQFRYFGRFLTSPYSFHPASSKSPHSTPFVFGNFPPSINPLFHVHTTRWFVHFKGCDSTPNICVYFLQCLYASKHLSPTHQS